MRNDFNIKTTLSFQTALELMKLGSPPAFNNLLTSLRLILMNQIFLSVAGNLGLAIFSILTMLEKFSLVIISGLSQATSPFIGVFTKEFDTVSIRRIEKYAYLLGITIIALIALGIFIFADEICNYFGIETVDAIDSIRIFSYSLIPSVICLLMFFYYQAAGFTTIANILIFCKSFILIVIPAYLLINFGISTICWAFTICSVGALLILIPILIIYPKNLSRPLLQDLHTEKNGNYISFSVKSSEQEIMSSVDKIVEFCSQNQLPNRETTLVQLSMEEMLISIMEKSGATQMDVRILIVDNKIVLRIRNGGKMFNPLAYGDSSQSEDTIGINMIRKMTENVNYKRTFGINNLTIVIEYGGNAQ